jgi:hypothetical protein
MFGRLVEVRASDLTAKDRGPVAKHHDLKLLEPLGSTAKRDELEHASQSEVG